MGGFPNSDVLAAWAEHFGLEGAAPATLIAAGFGAAATMHVATSMVVATGEEIGWRGFLVPEARRLGWPGARTRAPRRHARGPPAAPG